MASVNEVFITKEVADELNINASYLIRIAKRLYESGEITADDMRSAGKRNYIFNKEAMDAIRNALKRK